MHAKAFEQSFIHIKKTKNQHNINKQITKPSPRVPSGVAILSHPRERSAASRRSSIGFGVFVLFVKESPPSIMVTRKPNWSFRDSKARDWLRKGKVLAPLVRPT